jgi:hypothetical protein
MTQSGFTQLGYMSALHVVYLACIKPYVDPYRLPSSWRARTVVAGLRSAFTATWRPPRHQRHISR